MYVRCFDIHVSNYLSMHVPDLLCLGGAAGIGRVISRSTLSPSVLLEMSSVCLNTKSHFIYLQLISSNGHIKSYLNAKRLTDTGNQPFTCTTFLWTSKLYILKR